MRIKVGIRCPEVKHENKNYTRGEYLVMLPGSSSVSILCKLCIISYCISIYHASTMSDNFHFKYIFLFFEV